MTGRSCDGVPTTAPDGANADVTLERQIMATAKKSAPESSPPAKASKAKPEKATEAAKTKKAPPKKK